MNCQSSSLPDSFLDLLLLLNQVRNRRPSASRYGIMSCVRFLFISFRILLYAILKELHRTPNDGLPVFLQEYCSVQTPLWMLSGHCSAAQTHDRSSVIGSRFLPVALSCLVWVQHLVSIHPKINSCFSHVLLHQVPKEEFSWILYRNVAVFKLFFECYELLTMTMTRSSRSSRGLRDHTNTSEGNPAAVVKFSSRGWDHRAVSLSSRSLVIHHWCEWIVSTWYQPAQTAQESQLYRTSRGSPSDDSMKEEEAAIEGKDGSVESMTAIAFSAV